MNQLSKKYIEKGGGETMGHPGRKAGKILRLVLQSLKPFGWPLPQGSVQQRYEAPNSRQQSDQQRLYILNVEDQNTKHVCVICLTK